MKLQANPDPDPDEIRRASAIVRRWAGPMGALALVLGLVVAGLAYVEPNGTAYKIMFVAWWLVIAATLGLAIYHNFAGSLRRVDTIENAKEDIP